MTNNSFPLAHVNGFRNENELVIYTGTATTNTNCYGIEACVVDGRIISFGKNDNPIPKNGYVLSGHGKAAAFLAENACEGAKVLVDDETKTVTIEVDDQALKIRAQKKIDEIHSRYQERISEKCSFDSEKAQTLLQSARDAFASRDYLKVCDICEEAYYYTAASKKGEIRAVWHRPTEKSPEEVDRLVKRLHDAGFNSILIETNYEGYATTKLLEHEYLPLNPRMNPDFDVLKSFILAGKKYGVKMHCWFEDFFYGTTYMGCPMKELHPEWMARNKDQSLLMDAYDTYYFLNPVLPEVRDLLVNTIREILDNYDFDGLQLDYIRYPVMHGMDHCAGFEPYTKDLFLKETGIAIDTVTDTESNEWKKFTAWRTQFITDYVNRIHGMMKDYEKDFGRKIELSTAVFGEPEVAIRTKCQDWRTWVENRWLDAIYPMAYLADADDVRKEVAYMVDKYGQAPNISGIAPMYSHLAMIESTKQVEAVRKAGAVGVAFFASHNCTDEQLEKLKIGVFRE